MRAMRILFATGAPFPPEVFSGAESSVAELISEVRQRGHVCSVVAGVHGRARRWAEHARWHLSGGLPMADWASGYAVWRVHPGRVPEVVHAQLDARRPALVVTWNLDCAEIAWAATRLGVPALVWVPDVEFGAYLERLPPVAIAACSGFVARRLGERTGVRPPVLRPLVRLEDYRAPRRDPQHVTLIHPSPLKGLEVVLAVARVLRHRRFALVDSWRVSRRERAWLRLRLAGLPNVRLQPPVPDARAIYARTALLMVPSQCEDASPRVVLEAQVNDIPVVASDIGGIPEVMGAGGMLVPPQAPARVWADAVESVLSSASRVAELAEEGRANAQRPELAPRHIADRFLALADEIATGRVAA